MAVSIESGEAVRCTTTPAHKLNRFTVTLPYAGMIATRLALSEGTVHNYVSTQFEKLDVPDRTRVAPLAVRHGRAD